MAETPNTLCRTCGIRRDMDGLCQCVDVLYARIRELEARPRPVAEWYESMATEDLFVGNVLLGNVYGWRAVCLLDDETFSAPDRPSARAWLEARVRAAGFEVKETTDA